MDEAGLVDGVITDDNDVFLFGASNVYKHLFENKKYVEEYSTKDIKTELGLDRDKLIEMALLLGSDYTEVGSEISFEFIKASFENSSSFHMHFLL